MTERPTTDQRLQSLREAGAPERDAVGWHYVQTLARRTRASSASAQPLLQGKLKGKLQEKLHQALDAFEARLQNTPSPPAALSTPATPAPPSPLARLLQEMRPAAETAWAMPGTPPSAALQPVRGQRAENPRVRQFRQQLRKISVQKQVRQAIARAPQNAGPINSHSLVLRALALMQDISPDYLNRFMTHVDALLCLDEAERQRLQPAKAAKPVRPARG